MPKPIRMMALVLDCVPPTSLQLMNNIEGSLSLANTGIVGRLTLCFNVSYKILSMIFKNHVNTVSNKAIGIEFRISTPSFEYSIGTIQFQSIAVVFDKADRLQEQLRLVS